MTYSKPLKIYLSPRKDGRYQDLFWSTYHQLKNLQPELAYHPQIPPEDFPKWKRKVRIKLKTLLNFPDVPLQPQPHMVDSQQRQGYVLQKWEAYPEPDIVYAFFMLIPDSASAANPVPAVICIPGASGTKELLAGELECNGKPTSNRFPQHNAMAKHYAQAGFVALAFDHLYVGETNENIPPQAVFQDKINANVNANLFLWWMGRSLEANAVFYFRQILQWLKRQPTVDPSSIATSGHSLGAKHALMLGILDPTIRAVVWNDFVSNWRERQVAQTINHHCIYYYQLLPGLQKYFDYLDLMAALAPAPLLVTEGGRTEDLKLVKNAYAKTKMSSNFKYYYLDKFASPAQRKYDRRNIPEGIDTTTYFKYCNVDPQEHYFKENLAVPWLKNILRP